MNFRPLAFSVLAIALAFGLLANASAQEPRYGGSITVAVTDDPPNLDPHITNAASARNVLHNVFATIVEMNLDFVPVGGLAESWDISDDGLTYTFNLREGVVFSDGTDLTARAQVLGVPLAIACTDLATRTLVTIERGSIAEAVRASCALPGIFAPVTWEGRILIDGGFLAPVPFPALAGAAGAWQLGVQAGVDVRRSRLVRTIRRFNVSGMGRAFDRRARQATGLGALSQILRGVSISLSSYSRGVRVPTGATLLRVDPGIAWWDFHRSPNAIAAGELATLALLEQRSAVGSGA